MKPAGTTDRGRPIDATARALIGDSIERAEYLVPVDERLQSFSESCVHVVTREIRITFRRVRTLYLTWWEEPTLNGHPIRLNVSRQPTYEVDRELQWTDMSSERHWLSMVGIPIRSIAVLEDQEGVVGSMEPASAFVVGTVIRVADSYIQITVLNPSVIVRQPEDAYRASWLESTVVTMIFPPVDLSREAELRIVEIE